MCEGLSIIFPSYNDTQLQLFEYLVDCVLYQCYFSLDQILMNVVLAVIPVT